MKLFEAIEKALAMPVLSDQTQYEVQREDCMTPVIVSPGYSVDFIGGGWMSAENFAADDWEIVP